MKCSTQVYGESPVATPDGKPKEDLIYSSPQ